MIKHNGCDCDQCGEHFTKAKDLKAHMATHNGPEAYVCHECGKIFGRKDSLGNKFTIFHPNIRPKLNIFGKLRFKLTFHLKFLFS